MTTNVTIDASGHRIEVNIRDGEDNNHPTVILEPGSPPHQAWIYGTQVMTIREIPADKE